MSQFPQRAKSPNVQKAQSERFSKGSLHLRAKCAEGQSILNGKVPQKVECPERQRAQMR